MVYEHFLVRRHLALAWTEAPELAWALMGPAQPCVWWEGAGGATLCLSET